MSFLVLYRVHDLGDDVLEALAVDEDGGKEYRGVGWVSATTNYYDPADVDTDGNPVAGAQTRAMTPAEVGEYALSLVLAQNPALVLKQIPALATASPALLEFSAPAPVEIADAPLTDAS